MQIIQHLVAMIRAKRNGFAAALLQVHQCFHHAVHVHIAFQVVGFIEVTRSIALGTAQVHKMNVFTQALHHARQVVVGAYAKRTRTKTQPIAGGRYPFYNAPGIRFGTHYAGQTQDGVGGIIGVNGQFDARFFRSRYHIGQKLLKIGRQCGGINILIAVEHRLELFQRIAFLCPGQTGDDVAL